MRTYRFYDLGEAEAGQLARALEEDGMTTDTLGPGDHPLPGWGVVASGEERSEGLLEVLAELYGGSYEGEDLSGA